MIDNLSNFIFNVDIYDDYDNIQTVEMVILYHILKRRVL